MARFSYTAEKEGGEVYTGVVQARDRFELYKIVRREGGRIRAVTEEGKAPVWSMKYWNSKISSVPEHEIITFARNLGAMLKAGLPLSRALSVLERQTKNPKFKEIIGEIGTDVRKGDALHVALGKFPKQFSRLFAAMVRAGEESGDLASSLNTIGEQMERTYALKKKIKGAMMYPAVIVAAIVVITVLMMVKVVPTLASTFESLGAKLPASTMIVINASNFLVHYTVFAVGIVVIVVGGFYAVLKNPKGKRAFERMVLALPVVGNLVRETNAARTARTMSSLLHSGVDMLTALEITKEVIQNSFFKEVIESGRASVQRGEPLSGVFEKNEKLYPPLVGEMIAVGEETGQLSEMLTRVAAFYEADVDEKTKDMSTIVEPFLMVFIGGAVGFFAVAMISPIYQLSSAI